MVKQAWHNLRYVHGSKEVTPLLYIFVYISFMIGVAFTYITVSGGEHAITMYTVMLDSAHAGGTIMWGVLMTLAALGILASLITRHRLVAEATAFLGFGLWFYLGWVYGVEGYADGIFIAVIPNVLFWVWFSLRIEWYRRVVVPVKNGLDLHHDSC
jgi:hypothetical protein